MKKPVSYLQCDKRWGKIKYAVKGENVDICHSGCGPTSMAMVIATWVDSSITPKETCDWALRNGFKALRQGTYYSYFKAQAKVYGLRAYQLNGANLRKSPDNRVHSRVLRELDKGNMVICCMGPGNWTRGGHFILLWQVVGNTALVNDPASTDLRRTSGSWERLRAEVKYYFVIEKPKGNKGGKDMAYNDKPDFWAEKAWEKAIEKQIIDGSRPKEAITRQELIVVLDRLGLLDERKG